MAGEGALRSRGFTLVELMLVVAIIGIALSLVGPMTIQQLDNAKRNQEREQVNQYLEHWRFYAAQRHRALVLETRGQRMAVFIRGDYQHLDNVYVDTASPALAEYEFEYLRFPAQRIGVNANGFWQTDVFRWYEPTQNDLRPAHKSLLNRGLERDES